MRIGVCVKQVPRGGDTWALDPGTHRLDRSGDAVMDPGDAVGVEIGLRLAAGARAELIALGMGPERAGEALRAAIAMGAGRGVLVTDPALAGADALTTARVLAAVARRERCDLVIAGAESGDGSTGIVPAAIAEILDVPALTNAIELAVDHRASRVTATRRLERGEATVEAAVPVVVSLAAAAAVPRLPTLRGIRAAHDAPLAILDLAALGLESLAGATGQGAVVAATALPARAEPQIHVDNGDSGPLIADFLALRQLL